MPYKAMESTTGVEVQGKNGIMKALSKLCECIASH